MEAPGFLKHVLARCNNPPTIHGDRGVGYPWPLNLLELDRHVTSGGVRNTVETWFGLLKERVGPFRRRWPTNASKDEVEAWVEGFAGLFNQDPSTHCHHDSGPEGGQAPSPIGLSPEAGKPGSGRRQQRQRMVQEHPRRLEVLGVPGCLGGFGRFTCLGRPRSPTAPGACDRWETADSALNAYARVFVLALLPPCVLQPTVLAVWGLRSLPRFALV